MTAWATIRCSKQKARLLLRGAGSGHGHVSADDVIDVIYSLNVISDREDGLLFYVDSGRAAIRWRRLHWLVRSITAWLAAYRRWPIPLECGLLRSSN